MSFAVIQTGGKQYKVSTSEILKIERLIDQEGTTVKFKKVLFLNYNNTTEIGNPNIEGASVEAIILKNTKNSTISVFKKRRRKNSRKKYGHRQPISLIKITKIFSKKGKLIAELKAKKEIVPVKTKEKVKVKTSETIIKPDAKTKKVSTVRKKTLSKKKSLTTKKK